MTSDGGGLLLREVDRRLNLVPRVAACFHDRRNASYISHRVQELIAQRVYEMSLGYEDLGDHDQLRQDPPLAVLSGKPGSGRRVAGGQEHF